MADFAQVYVIVLACCAGFLGAVGVMGIVLQFSHNWIEEQLAAKKRKRRQCHQS